jgi:hypothetical protein
VRCAHLHLRGGLPEATCFMSSISMPQEVPGNQLSPLQVCASDLKVQMCCMYCVGAEQLRRCHGCWHGAAGWKDIVSSSGSAPVGC